jgi:hypothetical protein
MDILLFVIVLFFILTMNPSFKESIDGTIPVSFPRSDTIKLPSNMVQGDITVQGPVLLGIEGSGTDLTYLEINQSQLLFNSAGYDRSSDAVMYTNDDGLTIKAGKLNLDAEVNTGTLDASIGNITFMHVNRSGSDRYPPWESGIHTWDLYANGTIGAGSNGEVAAYINREGNMGCNGTATLNQVYGNSFNIENADVLGKIDELNATVGQINQGISQLHRDIDHRNWVREQDRLRKLREIAEAAAAEAARIAEVARVEAARVIQDAANRARDAYNRARDSFRNAFRI